MTVYYRKSEIEAAMKLMVSDYLKNCIECNKLSDDFIDLIKYNFLAKFVALNKEKHTIEIGIEDVNAGDSHYPVINVFSFPLKEKKNPWLDKSFKSNKNDLVFYGTLLNRKKYNDKNTQIVLM